MVQLPKLLIIDDEPNNISLLVGSLDEDYDIYCSTNGFDAIKIIETQDFDLILLDIVMPEISGYEVCKKIKTMPDKKSIPIIFVSARTSELDQQKGFNCGAIDYIMKPYSIPIIKARIATHIKLKQTYEKIDTISKKRSELLHMLCHDLANHFSTIANGLELMNSDPNLISDCLPFVNMANIRGLELINTIKDMEAVEEKSLQITPVDLVEAIHESLEVLKHLYNDKNITIHLDLEDNLWLQAEKVTLINSVINNLISNAIKFSYPDSTILVKAWSKYKQVVLEVSDTGIGMSTTLQNQLFDISKKTSRTGTAGEKGTGFGMSLIQRLMSSYQGTIKISSKDIQSHPESHGTQIALIFNQSKSISLAI
ncbi:MAG: hybrid sensor histidine kinase/response regulator [Candidatus Cloacimonetes bacterium]|nr:hybrid sensor histidine kinase/response regulator [Candidatus Cloacimonadota bacterium]